MTLPERLARAAPRGITLRAETEGDVPFLERLYASTRAEEMAQVPWPAETITAFLRSQCALQRAHYQAHYSGAHLLLIEREGTPIGRIYLHESTGDLRLMDIALLPDARGAGLGSALLVATLDHARDQGIRVTLHVEPGNPAQRLYTRLGFRLVERRGVYDFLEWPATRPLDALVAEDFEPCVGEPFTLRDASGETRPLVLDSVRRRPSARPGAREGYSVVFDSASAHVLPQQIYRLEHEALGVMDVFLVPVGPGARGIRYEAVFG